MLDTVSGNSGSQEVERIMDFKTNINRDVMYDMNHHSSFEKSRELIAQPSLIPFCKWSESYIGKHCR